jgi:hypothetical protein
VIAAQVFIPLVEAPRDGEAGDNTSEEVLGFVSAQNRHAGAVKIFFPRLLVELAQGPLPILPVGNVIVAGRVVGSQQGRDHLLAGLRPDSPKAQGENELALAGSKVDFRGQRNVPVFRALVLPRHLEVS